MKTDSILHWVIYFIVTVIVAWIALSIILMWFAPTLYNPDGSVNWWVTLWIAALVIIFAWIIVILLRLIISLFREGFDGCKERDPCPKPCPPKVEPCPKPCPPKPCDPCDVRSTNPHEGMWL